MEELERTFAVLRSIHRLIKELNFKKLSKKYCKRTSYPLGWEGWE